METEYINDKDEPRMLSKFEEESLKDNYWNNEDFEDKSEDNFKEWKESMGWVDIDIIMKSYIKENE